MEPEKYYMNRKGWLNYNFVLMMDNLYNQLVLWRCLEFRSS